MQKHTRYLELRLAQVTPRPELHRYQTEALHELLEIARSGDNYLQRSKNLFSLARAEWMDRHHNAAELFEALGDERQQRASLINLRAGESATGYAELTAAMTTSCLTAAPLTLAAQTTTSTLAPLLTNLLEWKTEAARMRRHTRSIVIKGLWKRLQQYDPGCSWERICSYPPYRHRLPFSDHALAIIGGWLREAVGTQLVQVDLPEPVEFVPAPVADEADYTRVPSASEAAVGFHAMYDAIIDDPQLAETRSVYERIFAIEALGGDANDFMCRAEEADLVCEIARIRQVELAKDGLAHCQGLSQPHLELHFTTLRDTVKRCASRTEVEYEVARLDACNAIENAWNHVFIHYAFRSITAAMGYELNRTEQQRATVRSSNNVVTALFGADWNAMMSTPRVWEFFSEVVFTRAQCLIDQPHENHGLRVGEVGLGLIQQIRDDALLHVTDFVQNQGHETAEEMHAHAQELVNSQRFSTPEQMRDHVSAMFAAAMDGADEATPVSPKSGPQPLIYWGQRIDLAAVSEVLSSPPRPC